jgi:hypothetical protein
MNGCQVVDRFGNRQLSYVQKISLLLFGPPPPGETSLVPDSTLLVGTTAIRAVQGAAYFQSLYIEKASEMYKIVASGLGLSLNDTSPQFSVVAAQPFKLIASASVPKLWTAGVAYRPRPPLRYYVVDQFSNIVTQYSEQILLGLVESAAVSAVLRIDESEERLGVASFSAMTMTAAGAGFQLQASSGALAPVLSQAFSVIPGDAARIAFDRQIDDNVISGQTLTVQPRIAAYDFYGNLVDAPEEMVNISLRKDQYNFITRLMEATQPPTAEASLGGNTQRFLFQGYAAFMSISVSSIRPFQDYRLMARMGTLEVLGSSFTVIPAEVLRLRFESQPPATLVAGLGDTSIITVGLYDPQGRIVRSVLAPVLLSLVIETEMSNAATLLGYLADSTQNGLVSFTGIMIGGAGRHFARHPASQHVCCSRSQYVTNA